MNDAVQANPLQALGEHFAAAIPGVTGFTVAFGELTLDAAVEKIVQTVEALRDDPQGRFVSIIDVAGADYPAREKRFDVIYHLLSPFRNQRVRVKVQADDETLVPSITGAFPGAVWFEREAYDMYGILFSGHPDLRRLLSDYGFDGHPLRKDFPLTGYAEVRYDDEQKRVVYEPVKLNQEFRNFDFLSPWKARTTCCPATRRRRRREAAAPSRGRCGRDVPAVGLPIDRRGAHAGAGRSGSGSGHAPDDQVRLRA